MIKNILFIGGAGYIGSITCELLAKHQYNIVVCDDLSTGYKENLLPQIPFYQVDMLDQKTMDNIFSKYKFDLVIVFAAKIIVPESVKLPNEYFQTNILGLNNILQLMNKHQVKKIIFASSAAVYGQPSVDKIVEKTSKNPINPYGQSKLANEWSLQNNHYAYGIDYVAFRFFNVAGCSSSCGNRKPNPSSLVAAIIKSILHNQPIKIFGNHFPTKDGTCVRDYIDARDLANACLLAIPYLEKNKSGEFNLGSNCGYSVQEVVNQAKQILAPNHPVEILPSRDGDPAQLITDNQLAFDELGWKPNYNLEEMIKSEYAFRSKHKI